MNSRLCSARSSASRRRHAGSTFKKVYLTKCRSRAMASTHGSAAAIVAPMRVALVSPYSWAHPGGVNQHVEALATTLAERGHEVRAFAPLARDTPAPPWLVPLGATAGWSFNGAVSTVALPRSGVAILRGELRAFAPDVVHLHEPVVPMPCWDTLMTSPAPLVGTFHTYGTNRWTHGAG